MGRVSDKSRANIFNSLEKNGKPRRSDSRSFKIGDIVWAKVFAYTWWPGFVSRINNSMVLVLFYGCENTHWFKASRICVFEENYARISRMVGVKLSEEIEMALEDFRRRTALGLICSCRGLDSGANGDSEEGIVEIKKAFEPVEVLEFVAGMGMCVAFGDGEMARVVRISAQANAFRQYVSVCWSNKIDHEFVPEGVLVSGSDAEEESIVGKDEEQVKACRDLDSVQPDWENQQNVGLEDCSLGGQTEGSDNEMPSDFSSVSGMAYGYSRELEYDFQVDMHEEDCEVLQNKWQEGREICIISRMDFSMFELDKEDDSLADEPPDVKMHNSCSVISSVEPIIDKFSDRNNYMKDVDQSSGSETECHESDILVTYDAYHTLVNKSDLQHTDHVGQTWKASLHNSLVAILDNEELNQHNHAITVAEDAIGHASALPVFSSELDNCFQESPVHKRSLTTSLASTSDPHSPGPLSSCVGPQSGDKVSALVGYNKADKNDILSVLTSSALPLQIAHASIPQKRQLNQVIIAGNISKLQKLIASSAGSIRDPCSVKGRISSTSHSSNACPMMDCLSSIGTKTLNCEDIASRCVTEKALVLVNADNNVIQDTNADKLFNLSHRNRKRAGYLKANHSLDSSVSVSRGAFKQQKVLDEPNVFSLSKWRRYYASPLARDVLKSSSKAHRSLADNCGNCPRSLHMKFPKGFKLPSKEELEKKFGVFGPLDCSRTRIFFFTGAGRVVFLQHSHANAACQSVRKKSVFGEANVRFWLDEFEDFRNSPKAQHLSVSIAGQLLPVRKKNVLREANAPFWVDKHEDYRKGNKTQNLSLTTAGQQPSVRKENVLGEAEAKGFACSDKCEDFRKSEKALDLAVPTMQSPNVKSCLKRPSIHQERDQKKPRRVRFIMVTDNS